MERRGSGTAIVIYASSSFLGFIQKLRTLSQKIGLRLTSVFMINIKKMLQIFSLGLTLKIF
jgi:hypothetical protein